MKPRKEVAAGPADVELIAALDRGGAEAVDALLAVASDRLRDGDPLGAQRLLSLGVPRDASRRVIHALARFWAALESPRMAMLGLAEAAERACDPWSCIRLSELFAEQGLLVESRSWWIRAGRLLLDREECSGKQLVTWVDRFRPAFGHGAFRAAGLVRDGARLLALARLLHNPCSVGLHAKVDALRSVAASNGDVRIDVQPLLASLPSWMARGREDADPLGAGLAALSRVRRRHEGRRSGRLHVVMNLGVGGLSRRMLRSIRREPHPRGDRVVSCRPLPSPTLPGGLRDCERFGLDVRSLAAGCRPRASASEAFPGTTAPQAERLAMLFDPSEHLAALHALEQERPEEVVVWGGAALRQVTSALRASSVPAVRQELGALLHDHTPDLSVGARCRREFIVELCAMNLADPRFVLGANCKAVADDVVRVHGEGLPEERIRVRYNPAPRDIVDAACPDSAQALRRALGIPVGHRVVGLLARLAPVKNVPLWLDVAALVRARHGDTSFLVVGDGPQREALGEYADALGIADRVTFVGEHHAQLPALLGIMDVLLCTSDSEALSNAILEAQAMGVPVVARRVGGNAEAVAEGVTGLVVDAADAKTLAASTLEVLCNPALGERLGTAGPRWVAALDALPDLAPAEAPARLESIRARLGRSAGEPSPDAPTRQ